jgi:hypothetical protein
MGGGLGSFLAKKARGYSYGTFNADMKFNIKLQGASVNQAAKDLGVIRQTLAKAIKAGLVQDLPDHSIDVDAIRSTEWYRNLSGKGKVAAPIATRAPIAPIDPKEKEKAAKIQQISKALGIKIDPELIIGIDKIHIEKLLLMERRESLRLENTVRRGELWESEAEQAAFDSLVTATRSHLLLTPAKLAHKVAATNDPAECQVIIDKEIREALQSLSEHKLHAA